MMASYAVAPACPKETEVLISGGVSPLLARVLSSRGITSMEEANQLICPLQLTSHDPFLLEDMEKAVARIHAAIAAGETIAVFGDYDVDGITSTSLLTKGLGELGATVISYIPKRFGEGYGLNNGALDRLKNQGVSLVITVDCGISGYTQVEHGNSLGLDMIITDHHSCPAQLPPALAIVNPRRENSPYPFDKLAGVGVALKLVQALSPSSQWEDVLRRYSDLVAVGTVADVMPLVDENRYLVALGLEKLNNNPLVGLQQLLEESSREKEVTSTTIGFNVAPRVNAAGRLDETHIALELLLTKDVDQGRKLALELCQLNTQRQAIEGEIVEECLAMLEKEPPGSVVFLWQQDWHPGVLGIVASRLAEKFHRPAFILCTREGIAKGSCRSYGKINLYDVLTECAPELKGFGGHAQAAGFTVAESNLNGLKKALENAVGELPEGGISQEIKVDARVTIGDISIGEIKGLEALEPCGASCPRPTFCMEGAEVRYANLVAEGKHLRLRVALDGREVDGIYFHYTGKPLEHGTRIDLAFYPRINSFRGTETPQMQIFSIKDLEEPPQGEDLLVKLQERGYFTSEEAKALIPERSAFVTMWNWLKKQAKSKGLSQVSQEVTKASLLPYGQEQVCLAVFLERGLVKLDSNGGVAFPPQSQKIDLEQSPIMVHLQGCITGY